MKHSHWPERSPGRSYGAVPGHTPWVTGERAICGGCGHAIRFVEGYEMRRDYWVAVPETRDDLARRGRFINDD